MYVLYNILRGLLKFSLFFFESKGEVGAVHWSRIVNRYVCTSRLPISQHMWNVFSLLLYSTTFFFFLSFFFRVLGLMPWLMFALLLSQIEKIYMSRIGNSFSKFDVPDSLDIDGPSAIYIIEYTHARETRLFLTRISLLSFTDGKMGTILIRRVYVLRT